MKKTFWPRYFLELVFSCWFVLGMCDSLVGAEIFFTYGDVIELSAKPTANRFEEPNKSVEYDGEYIDIILPDSETITPIGCISFWAKLPEQYRAWDEFDLVLLYADTQPERSYLRFRYDGYSSVANSLITISAGRFVDWRGDWFFDVEGKPSWFHVVLIPHENSPSLYVNGSKISGYDSKNGSALNSVHRNPIWSNWEGQNIVISGDDISSSNRFIGKISDLRVDSKSLDQSEIQTLYDGNDSDQDGLSDWFEYRRGMNRFASDSDADGLSDFTEMGRDTFMNS